MEQLAAKDGYQPHAEPIFRKYALLAGVDATENNDNSDEDSEYEYDDMEDEPYDLEIGQEELQDLDDEDFLTPGVDAQIDNQSNISDANPDANPNADADLDANDDANANANPTIAEDEDEIPRDDEPIPNPPRRTARTPKPRSFLKPSFKGQIYEEMNHLVTQIHPEQTLEYESAEAEILAQAFVQTYNLTCGIQKFGDKGKQAAIDEMRQLHDRACFRPININDLDERARRAAMESLIFLVEKRDGRVKARTVVMGASRELGCLRKRQQAQQLHWNHLCCQQLLMLKKREKWL